VCRFVVVLSIFVAALAFVVYKYGGDLRENNLIVKGVIRAYEEVGRIAGLYVGPYVEPVQTKILEVVERITGRRGEEQEEATWSSWLGL